MRRLTFFLNGPLAACLLAGGCADQESPAPEQAAPERIENPELQVAIAALPEGYDLATNRGATLELVREPGLPSGRAWVEVSAPVAGGVNLIEEIRGEREAFESLPGGSFSGNGELVLSDGRPAYYSRGRFEHEGALVEEFRVRSVHPVHSDRVLLVSYRYSLPEGVDPRKESAQRLEDLLYLLGEIEGLPAEAAGEPATGTS